jgi:phosphate acetyltransferase
MKNKNHNAGTAQKIENRTFDEIAVGETASLSRTLSKEDIELFAAMSGDVNPAHMDEGYAKDDIFHGVIAHGMWGGALVSTVLGTLLPGPGTIYLGQDLRFRRPVRIGDTVTVSVTAKEKRPEKKIVIFDCHCINQDGKDVISGTAEVIAPAEKVSRDRVEAPEFVLQNHDRYQQLIARCDDLPAIATAVVHPCSEGALRAAVEAAEAGLIDPTLVGPEGKIRTLADAVGLDLSPYRLVDVPHSHAAAMQAVALVRAGKIEALMKGSLHTDELIREVTSRETGLRTGRRISHAFVMDVPGHAHPLIVTDAAINIYPSLDDKRDICQNAIDLAHILTFPEPRVAILSAVETINPKIASTIEAAALCKMAQRGQITGAPLDGPLAFDNAISEEAARTKGIESPVAGRANILVVPDLEAGNMLAKQLTFLAKADAAGIVLGARVPIILTSRADNLRTRLASCAVAALIANAQRQPETPAVLAE